MNKLYALHIDTEVLVMQDGSGIVLFSGLNGRSVFIQNKLFGTELKLAKIDMDLSEQNKRRFEIKSILNLSEEDTLKTEKWLLNNNFISAYSC
mgnify:CR=1 FL=1